MCYALLTTCKSCTWLIGVTYPRCSHAVAYAIDPAACPHRMRRRYKSSGFCTACTNRKNSLSVTPCEVRIAFRNTEIGVVEEQDQVGWKTPVEQGMEKEHEGNRSFSRDDGERAPRKTRATGGERSSFVSLDGNSGDEDDVYIDDGEEGSDDGTEPAASDEEELRRKRKNKPMPRKPANIHRRKQRTPGLLERIHYIQKSNNVPGDAVKKKRGRPRKIKQQWPDRIDAAVYEPKHSRRKSTVFKSVPVKRSAARPKPVKSATNDCRRPLPYADEKTYAPVSGTLSKVQGNLQTQSMKAPVLLNDLSDDNLAQLIALEASRREKKWR